MGTYHTGVNGKGLLPHPSWERLGRAGGRENGGGSEWGAWKELKRQRLTVVIKRKMTDEK